MDVFDLGVTTANGSCWSTSKRFIMAGAGGAHILCVQEHRLQKAKLMPDWPVHAGGKWKLPIQRQLGGGGSGMPAGSGSRPSSASSGAVEAECLVAVMSLMPDWPVEPGNV